MIWPTTMTQDERTILKMALRREASFQAERRQLAATCQERRQAAGIFELIHEMLAELRRP